MKYVRVYISLKKKKNAFCPEGAVFQIVKNQRLKLCPEIESNESFFKNHNLQWFHFLKPLIYHELSSSE